MELVNNNRIIGGINEASAVKIKELYSTFVKGEMFLTTSRTAEMCKLMENTYRDVNIALANELALISENYKINAWEVISLCNKHPRVNIHNPGPGVGGHCLAVDPWFIVQSSPNAKMISMAREINDSMPEHIFKCIQAELSHITGKKRICILGMSYKANVDDVRESPIIHLIKLMEKNKNYEVSVFDPHVKLKNMWLCDKLIDGCKNAHLLVLGVNHDCFKNIDLDLIGKVMEEKRILDTRNFFKQQSVESHGFTYRLFGKEA